MAVLGVDIGGMDIKGARIDIDKGVLFQGRIRIPVPSPADLEQMLDVIDA
ncbi:MAG TPA: hypothetical protein PLE10_03580 [Brevefilum sp.]|mgnify:CR=1 FL=1|nr:hypothetical protein [Brevefilum sp.]HOR18894.1 hypothetical protein [Brevefilum sp.]HPL70025.1 hypothetical protein [Brevefilum sp.]